MSVSGRPCRAWRGVRGAALRTATARLRTGSSATTRPRRRTWSCLACPGRARATAPAAAVNRWCPGRQRRHSPARPQAYARSQAPRRSGPCHGPLGRSPGGGWRVEGGRRRAEGGRVEGGGWSMERGAWFAPRGARGAGPLLLGRRPRDAHGAPSTHDCQAAERWPVGGAATGGAAWVVDECRCGRWPSSMRTCTAAGGRTGHRQNSRQRNAQPKPRTTVLVRTDTQLMG